MKHGHLLVKWQAVLAALTLAVVVGGQVQADPQPEWHEGDVFLAVGDGSYHVFDRGGTFKQSLQQDGGGYTTDCGFSPGLDKLYTVNYTRSKVVVYDSGTAHGIVQTIDPREASPEAHSGAIVFAADGSFYVGHPDGNQLIHKYDDAGMLLGTFQVQTDGRRGTNWVDLAADQQTLFYTSAGRLIQRFDTQASEQLDDFAELPGDGHAEAIRLLSPGDGSGGLLVADGADIKRLDETGRVVKRYDVSGQNDWFAINLDPDGRSFWATDQETDQVARFDIDTGRMRQGFLAGPGGTVFGVCLRGELTAGVPQIATNLPMAYQISQNVPNPFNPSTEISYRLPESGAATLEIFNLAGQRVTTLVQGEQKAGTYTVTWRGRDDRGREVSSGVYFYRFTAGGMAETHRMLLLK